MSDPGFLVSIRTLMQYWQWNLRLCHNFNTQYVALISYDMLEDKVIYFIGPWEQRIIYGECNWPCNLDCFRF